METKEDRAILESRCLVLFFKELEALLQRDRRPAIIKQELRLGAAGVTVRQPCRTRREYAEGVEPKPFEIIDRQSGDVWAKITFDGDRPLFEWSSV